MNENLKKLTGKNPRDFEPVAYGIINNSDTDLFQELVNKEDFLFDFIKQNVAKRLESVCNSSNFLNLLNFLKYYSPSYEEFIVNTLAKYANEDLTDNMLEILENGTEDEKTYCAKFFSYIQDPLAIDLLRENAYSENPYLSSNCVSTLAIMGDTEIYNSALKKLNSEDEFEKLEGVKLLVSYGNKDAVKYIINAIKTSSLAENMAVELLYLTDFEVLENNDKLFILNLITDSLGEVSGLSQVFDFRLYEQYEKLIKSNKDSKVSAVLINAKNKFETLTENDEYLFDETKDVKQEIFNIKELLNFENLQDVADEELNENSPFVFTVLEYTKNIEKVRDLLNCSNQTIILKAVEVLKRLNELTIQDKQKALTKITNTDIKNIIEAIGEN